MKKVNGGSQWKFEDGQTHYEKNKTQYVSRIMKRKQKLFSQIWEYKSSHQCVDCGNNNPIVLDFDHIDDNKFKEISTMANYGYSWKRILEEIKKCEVVCSNCHRIRTAKRRLG